MIGRNKTIRRCEACGVIKGGQIYHEIITEYRGHNICSWCINKWKQLEAKLGKTIDFKDYSHPPLEEKVGKTIDL